MKNRISAILFTITLAFMFSLNAQARVNWRLASQVGFTLKSADLLEKQKCYLEPSDDLESFAEAIELKAIELRAEDMLYNPFNPDVEADAGIRCDKQVVQTCLSVAVDQKIGECGTETIVKTVINCLLFQGKSRTKCLSALNSVLVKDDYSDAFQNYLDGAKSCLQSACKRVAAK